MNIQLLAFLLLVGRLISDLFIIMVLRKQWKLRRTRTHPRLVAIRRVLTLLAVLVFIGNLYPLLLDAYTLIDASVRTSRSVNLVGVIYSLDNNLTFMFASILIWTLYKLSDTVIEVAELIAGGPIKDLSNKKDDILKP
ncbi:hypothetical protein [Polynucleobacter sp.]|uniref:hypothetical protein n=1 Tax=Polynucleobacter sp. TaxID=2029855 RepID=UPI003F6971D6